MAAERPDRHGIVIGLGLVVLLAVGIAVVSIDDDAERRPESRAASPHGTRPPRLGAGDVTRAGRAFGIEAGPERIPGGWEAEDAVRSLYLLRAPSAWYVTFEDASTLLEPVGDRATICSASDPPFACTLPGEELVADMAAEPPGEAAATRAARGVLERAGLLTGTWTSVVLDASVDALPCRDGLDTPFDCTRQVVPTRAVMLTRDLGPGTTAARFGVVVGPRGNVLTVTGRVAERVGG